MSATDRFGFAVAVLFLWILAVGLAGIALQSFEGVPSRYSFTHTISLMVLGGVLYLLSLTFVNYYGGIEFRLF
ncbi:hypothetical protein SAMN04487967_3674 [Natronorubrum sediminis]|uniref:Uncharacterized protein n=1 Tax=Natronorubrum sediminis TaxID=640943 RepID=A0A1H6G518_9EURY|nr:hypothetical protein SAMN04487967_3674 [Natronorubrum sediminis]